MVSIFKTPQGRAAAQRALPGSKLISGTFRKNGKYVRVNKSLGYMKGVKSGKITTTVRDRGSGKINRQKGKELVHRHGYGFDQSFRKK